MLFSTMTEIGHREIRHEQGGGILKKDGQNQGELLGSKPPEG